MGIHLYSLHYVNSSSMTNLVGQEFLYVHDAFERAYRNLLSDIGTRITSADYQSPAARSVLLEADANYARAITLAGEGRFQNATIFLSEAASTLSQANSIERTYVASVSTSQSSSLGSNVSVTSQQSGTTGNWYSQPLVVGGAGIAAAAVAIVMISVVRRRI